MIITRKLFGGKPVQAYFEVSDVFVFACMFVDAFILGVRDLIDIRD